MTIKNIPVGYKDSPLGIIPMEWEVKRLGEITTQLKTFSFSREMLTNEEQFLMYIHYGDIHKSGEKSKIDLKYERLPFLKNGIVPDYEIKKDNFPLLIDGDIVMPDASEDYNGIGHAWNLQNVGEYKVIGGLHTIAMRPNQVFISIDYSALMFGSYLTLRTIKKSAQGTKVYSISYNHIQNALIPLPPLAEQEKIAEILTTWDKAIEKQTQLIQKLELRKKGLMQQLLTGKKRLPGFTGEWEKVKLGEITTFLSCNTFSREQMNNVSGNLKNVHYGDVLVKYSFIVDVSKYKDSIPYINDMIEYSPKDYVESGDIVMADTAEDEMVGRACEFTNVGEQKIISGLHTILIRPIIQFAPMFLGYYLNSREYHKQILSIMQGIKVYSITKEALKNTTIKYPTMQEQTAIANILSSCDEEIRLAQDKLAAMQEQKKGLMQVLLTGKRRVSI